MALSFAPGHADAHCVQGMLYSAAGQLEAAASAFDQALAMDRCLAIAHGFAGYNAASSAAHTRRFRPSIVPCGLTRRFGGTASGSFLAGLPNSSSAALIAR